MLEDLKLCCKHIRNIKREKVWYMKHQVVPAARQPSAHWAQTSIPESKVNSLCFSCAKSGHVINQQHLVMFSGSSFQQHAYLLPSTVVWMRSSPAS